MSQSKSKKINKQDNLISKKLQEKSQYKLSQRLKKQSLKKLKKKKKPKEIKLDNMHKKLPKSNLNKKDQRLGRTMRSLNKTKMNPVKMASRPTKLSILGMKIESRILNSRRKSLTKQMTRAQWRSKVIKSYRSKMWKMLRLIKRLPRLNRKPKKKLKKSLFVNLQIKLLLGRQLEKTTQTKIVQQSKAINWRLN